MYFDGIRASSRFVTFRLYLYIFFIEDASLRQAVIEFLKKHSRKFVSEPNNMMSFSTLAYQFIHI